MCCWQNSVHGLYGQIAKISDFGLAAVLLDGANTSKHCQHGDHHPLRTRSAAQWAHEPCCGRVQVGLALIRGFQAAATDSRVLLHTLAAPQVLCSSLCVLLWGMFS